MARQQDEGLVGRLGPLEVDWPRTIGYYGGATLAYAAGMVEAPLALAIAAVPFLKMLNHGTLPSAPRFLGQLFEGAAKPIGGDAEGTIRLTQVPSSVARPRRATTRGTTTRRRTARRGGTRRTSR